MCKVSTILFLAVCFSFYSCEKDNKVRPTQTETLSQDCLPFDWSGLHICWPETMPGIPCDLIGVKDTVNFWGPVFNPNNSEELLVVYNPLINGSIPGEQRFLVYNHVSNTIIREFQIPIAAIDHPSWGVNDYILTSDNQFVYKVKSDGTDFQQLHPGYFPQWNSEDERYVFAYGPAFIANAEHEIVDTIPFSPNGDINEWSNEYGQILIDGEIYDLADDVIYDLPPEGVNAPGLHVYYRCWGSEKDEFVAVNESIGIIRYNALSNETTVIKENCSGKKYFHLSVSKDQQYIATVPLIATTISEDTLLAAPKLRVMNFDGSNEHSLMLPF